MDEELARWRSTWVAEAERPARLPDIRRIAERERRRLALQLGGQLVCCVGLLTFSAWWAWRWRSAEWFLWAAVIWVVTGFAARFAIRNSAGTWQATDQSTAGFIELRRRRAEAGLRGVRFGRRLLAVNLAIVVPWLSWDFARRSIPLRNYMIGLALTAGLTTGYLVAFWWIRRRKVRELKGLDEFGD